MSGSFSQIFGFTSGDDGADDEVRVQPAWWGPPDDELGVAVPQSKVLARSEQGVVALLYAFAYSTGAAFEFIAVARDLSRSEARRLFHEQHEFEPDDLPDGFLRLGVEMSDGSRASNLGGHRAHTNPAEEPAGPIFVQRGGGGGMGGQDRVLMRPGYWLWPLPPAGLLRLSCEWPTAEIAFSSVEIDADAIREAAEQALPLWPSSP